MANKSMIAVVCFVLAAGIFYYFSKDKMDIVAKKGADCEIGTSHFIPQKKYTLGS